MKTGLCFFLLFVSATFGAKVGDSYDSVIAEKGQPKSQVAAGSVKVLGYPDVTFKLKNDVIVSIIPSASLSAAMESKDSSEPDSPEATSVNAVKARLKQAIDRVKKIVNQPAPFVPRTPEISSQCAWFGDMWFHPGAITPDFANVDVRKSQETKNYEDYAYASSKFTPDQAFIASELEFNAMTKFFYIDRTVPKKKLTEAEMLEINRLYRIIAKCCDQLGAMGESPVLK